MPYLMWVQNEKKVRFESIFINGVHSLIFLVILIVAPIYLSIYGTPFEINSDGTTILIILLVSIATYLLIGFLLFLFNIPCAIWCFRKKQKTLARLIIIGTSLFIPIMGFVATIISYLQYHKKSNNQSEEYSDWDYKNLPII